jgi:nitrite reductase/ring-hydroxylating ferredoxin subunit
MPGRRATPLDPLLERVETAAALDAPAQQIGKAVRGALEPGPVRDALAGTWLGHALHPLLTDIVIGSFVSATMLDLLGGDDRSVRKLIGVGIAAYPATALTGATDWADSETVDDTVRRTGLVHAATNLVGLGFYSASLAARRRGNPGRGKALALGGAGVMALGGYLGAHLTFAKGVGPDQTVFDAGEPDWTPVEAPELRSRDPVRVIAGDTPVLLLRSGERILAIHDRCSHRGCSLAEGEIEGEDVVCACHGSRFSLVNGSVLRGPATAPQPAFEAREQDGRIEVRRRP